MEGHWQGLTYLRRGPPSLLWTVPGNEDESRKTKEALQWLQQRWRRLGLGYGGGRGEQRSHSRHTESEEPTGFTNELHVMCKNDFKALRMWKNGFAIYLYEDGRNLKLGFRHTNTVPRKTAKWVEISSRQLDVVMGFMRDPDGDAILGVINIYLKACLCNHPGSEEVGRRQNETSSEVWDQVTIGGGWTTTGVLSQVNHLFVQLFL